MGYSDMSQSGRYVYGIIEETGCEQSSQYNITNDDVSLIRYRDLAAVVSPASVKDFDRFGKQLMTPVLKHHQLVLENIMRYCTVIPMTFGIVARSEKDVRQLLKAAYIDLKDTFREVDDSVELNLQATCDEAEVLKEVKDKDEEVGRLRLELASASSGRATEIKIDLGRAVLVALDRAKQAYVSDVLDILNKIATRSCPGKLTTADMIMNESFLVRRDHENEFDQKVNLLAEEHGTMLEFKYVGPMPPYSFVDLEATVLDADNVERARKVLGVGEQTTVAEVNDAYRKLARQYHPDSNPGTPDGVEEFRQATEAYETLTRCIRGLDTAQNGRCTLKREQIEGLILVARRR